MCAIALEAGHSSRKVRQTVRLRDAREGSDWQAGLKGSPQVEAAKMRFLLHQGQRNRQVQGNSPDIQTCQLHAHPLCFPKAQKMGYDFQCDHCSKNIPENAHCELCPLLGGTFL